MGAKHTDGPWTARRMHTGGFDIVDARGRDVVTVYGGGVEIESREANARLIASAPDLLEALILALPYVEDASDSASPADQEIIRAVIARATGEAA